MELIKAITEGLDTVLGWIGTILEAFKEWDFLSPSEWAIIAITLAVLFSYNLFRK